MEFLRVAVAGLLNYRSPPQLYAAGQAFRAGKPHGIGLRPSAKGFPRYRALGTGLPAIRAIRTILDQFVTGPGLGQGCPPFLTTSFLSLTLNAAAKAAMEATGHQRD